MALSNEKLQELANEIAKITSIEFTDDLTPEALRTKFNSVFVAKKIAHEIDEVKNAVVGEEFKMLRRDAEKSGFVKPEDLKDGDKWKHPREIYKMVFDNVTSQIDEIKTKSTEGADKRIIDLQKALDEKDKSLTDFQKLNEELSGNIENLTTDFSNKLTSAKTQYLLKDVTGQFQYADNASPFAKTGFEQHMRENYTFPLKVDGDNETLEIKTKDGHYIPHPQDATKFATVADVWKTEMEKAKLLKVNNADSTKKTVNLYGDNGAGGDKDKPVNYVRKPLSQS